MQPSIAVTRLKKRFNNQEIFSDISFDVKEGEIVAIFGPNGCGKSTILNILSGLLKADGGDFKINNFDFFKFSYIFQNYRESLLPWRNNYENIAFPLELQKWEKQDILKRIRQIEEICNIKLNLKLFPYQMSGGQQQLIAFMRAIANSPRIIFMDEPFSALDYETNLILRQKFQNYYLEYNPTTLIITHDIEEAVHLANRIIVLSKKPTKIVRIISNRAPYPREISFLRSGLFNKIRDKVLAAFQEGADL